MANGVHIVSDNFCCPILFYMEDQVIKDFIINEQIREKEVMVIDGATGNNFGVMPTQQALKIADDMELDLVLLSPAKDDRPALCKILDYPKFRYDAEKKEKQSRKNQVIIKVKEIQLSISIDIGDIKVKAKRANEFLADGDKVKVVIRMHGRQNKRPENGIKIMNEFFAMLENAVMEQAPVVEGNNIRMNLAPQNKK